MQAKNKKEKGNRFENYLAETLKTIDPTTHRNYASGAGLDKNDIRLSLYDIEIEAKNAKQITLIKDWEQTQSQTHGCNIPVLMIRNPKKAEFEETLVVMDLDSWMILCKSYSKGTQDEKRMRIQGDTKKIQDLKYKLDWAKKSVKDLIKELESYEAKLDA